MLGAGQREIKSYKYKNRFQACSTLWQEKSRDMPANNPQGSALERARHLILDIGRAATCWQILHPDLSLWFSAAGDGVVGFVSYRQVRVVAGEPVCAADRLAAVCREFEQAAAAVGERVVLPGGRAAPGGTVGSGRPPCGGPHRCPAGMAIRKRSPAGSRLRHPFAIRSTGPATKGSRCRNGPPHAAIIQDCGGAWTPGWNKKRFSPWGL